MNYLRDNKLAVFLVFLTALSECFHLLFIGVPFNTTVMLDAAIYYLVNQIGKVTFLPAICFYFLVSKRKIASKSLLFGVIVWNGIQVFEEICYMLRINTDVLEISGTFWGRCSFMFVVLFFSAYGYSKWKR